MLYLENKENYMRNSFEEGVLESADIDRVHEKAARAIEGKRLNEKDFIEPYGEGNVQADLARVIRMEGQFAQDETPSSRELKKIAEIFEGVILGPGERNDWFGDKAYLVKTSRYDDYVNGVDAVIEFRSEEPKAASFLGLAADVTFSSDPSGKIQRLLQQVEHGELAKVKYFHSDYVNIHGQLGKLPEVIIGAERKTVLELGELWLAGKQDVLAQHKIQIMILTQMREQLETFALYAEQINLPEQIEASKIYRERLALVGNLLAEKAELVKKVQFELDNDSVHSSIMSFLKYWRKKMITGSAKAT
jgi:hypothetical protein